MYRVNFCLILLLFFNLLSAQESYPQGYFKNPVDLPIILAGTFAELRSNHFHSGIDIKTNKKIGIPIKSSAQGYVSRIKITHFGYGKAIYVNHPNGYTTVYAHLNNFSDKIEKYVKKYQYAKESYTIELYPKPSELQIDESEIIAFSGNTGGSTAPHLHFEIRDKQERPLNPMLFGIEVKDTRNPYVKGVSVVALNDSSSINGKKSIEKILLNKKTDGTLIANPLKIKGKVGFLINTNDRQDAAYNNNGVYNISCNKNGQKIYELDFKRFSFSETRYLNNLIDFSKYKTKKQRFIKLYKEQSNPLSIIKNQKEFGILNVKNNETINYTVDIKDFKNNKTKVIIPIKGVNDSISYKNDLIKTDYFIDRTKDLEIDFDIATIKIPKKALYKNEYLDLKINNDTLCFHYEHIPIHKKIKIDLDVSKYNLKEQEKLYIKYKPETRKAYSVYSWKSENKISFKTRNFGKYFISKDTINPTIKPVAFKHDDWMSSAKELKVSVLDDESGIQDYRATLNGKWILMEYEAKDDMLTYNFKDNIVTDTDQNLKVIVLDNVGNKSIFEATIHRKPE